MSPPAGIEFMGDVIRPRAAFAAEQFFQGIPAGDLSIPILEKAIVAMRATVADFIAEWCDMTSLTVCEQATVIANLQTVGVDAFRDRINDLHRQKAGVAPSQTGKVN
jgi:hypothetical protein